MERIPILRMGDLLLVTIQVDMHDRLAMTLQDDLTERIVPVDAKGVLIEVYPVDGGYCLDVAIGTEPECRSDGYWDWDTSMVKSDGSLRYLSAVAKKMPGILAQADAPVFVIPSEIRRGGAYRRLLRHGFVAATEIAFDAGKVCFARPMYIFYP